MKLSSSCIGRVLFTVLALALTILPVLAVTAGSPQLEKDHHASAHRGGHDHAVADLPMDEHQTPSLILDDHQHVAPAGCPVCPSQALCGVCGLALTGTDDSIYPPTFFRSEAWPFGNQSSSGLIVPPPEGPPRA